MADVKSFDSLLVLLEQQLVATSSTEFKGFTVIVDLIKDQQKKASIQSHEDLQNILLTQTNRWISHQLTNDAKSFSLLSNFGYCLQLCSPRTAKCIIDTLLSTDQRSEFVLDLLMFFSGESIVKNLPSEDFLNFIRYIVVQLHQILKEDDISLSKKVARLLRQWLPYANPDIFKEVEDALLSSYHQSSPSTYMVFCGVIDLLITQNWNLNKLTNILIIVSMLVEPSFNVFSGYSVFSNHIHFYITLWAALNGFLFVLFFLIGCFACVPDSFELVYWGT